VRGSGWGCSLPSEEELKRVRDEERADGFGLLPGVPEDDIWGPPQEETLLESGQKLKHHVKAYCSGNCCLHGTSTYVSCKAPRQWRSDRGIIEHVCPHGVGHPCRAGLEYATIVGKHHDDGVHGCDGCCREDWDLSIYSVPVVDQALDRDHLPEATLEDRLRVVEYAGYSTDGRVDGVLKRLKWAEEDIKDLGSQVNKRIAILSWLVLAAIAALGTLHYFG
jgi:hypothetical protein